MHLKPSKLAGNTINAIKYNTEYKIIQTSSANVATAQKENRVSISPVTGKKKKTVLYVVM